jgi:hypothetical protein
MPGKEHRYFYDRSLCRTQSPSSRDEEKTNIGFKLQILVSHCIDLWSYWLIAVFIVPQFYSVKISTVKIYVKFVGHILAHYRHVGIADP